MRDHDTKKLWARSGNICSYPECGIELVPEKRVDRVIGEQAHIKGEKPTAARYDPNQSPEERGSYENRILLCPTHHATVDADSETWTVERLLEMKASHEQQIIINRRFPELIDGLIRLVREFEPSDEVLHPAIPEMRDDSKGVTIARVDASKEEGVNTNIKVLPGQKLVFFARGLMSFDGGHNFATPEGILCNAYGVPVSVKDPAGNLIAPVVWPHEGAYMTDGDKLGQIGSLFGWIDEYSAETAFHIGTKKEIDVTEEGCLHLAVNDQIGTYGDNDGEFRVDIRVVFSEGTC